MDDHVIAGQLETMLLGQLEDLFHQFISDGTVLAAEVEADPAGLDEECRDGVDVVALAPCGVTDLSVMRVRLPPSCEYPIVGSC